MRLLPSIVLPAVLVLGASCGVRSDDRATFVPDHEVPFGLLGTTSTSAPGTEGAAPDVPVCLVRGEKVEAVDHALIPPATPLRILQLATEPDARERDQGLSTSLTDDAVVGAEVAGPTATVALGPPFSELAANVQLLAVAQIVCTLTLQPAVAEVRFTLKGTSVEVPRGDGSSTSDPVTRTDYATLISGAGRP